MVFGWTRRFQADGATVVQHIHLELAAGSTLGRR
jgi:hypothetical protein